MCFVLFCFCCCDACSSYSSKCVEFFILIISFISFILSILAFLFIKKDHLRLINYIMLIVLLIFSFIILFAIFLIIIFRSRKTINTTQNKAALVFSVIGLIISICYFISMISEISLIHSHYQEINHPCLSEDSDNDLIKNIDISKLEWESVQEFCIHNRDYNIHIITIKEFLIAYSFATSLLGFMLILIYSWFNEYRRIKYLIDGSLHDFKIQENKKENNNIEEEDESYNNEESEEKNKKINNNYNEINNEFENKNNVLKKLDTNKNFENKNSQDGITIYVNKNSLNKNIGSSDIMLTGNNTEKLTIKKKK